MNTALIIITIAIAFTFLYITFEIDRHKTK